MENSDFRVSARGSHSAPKSRQVFSIPELATLVARFSTQQDCARLLQTSKALYDITVPFVWEVVQGAQHLLLLISEAASYHPTFGEKGLEIYLTESFRASTDIFTRFDFYASHVKYLDVYGPKGETFKVTGWKVLVARAQQKILLPNLHTLVIKTVSDTNGPNQPMWIGTFSSPSLVNLLITDGNLWDTPTVSYPAASFMMKSLAAHQPKLERLELFPFSEVGNYVDEGESNLLAFLSGDPFYKYAVYFTSLKHLSCTFAWFEGPALQILGQLPHLETIDVCGVDEPEEASSELSEDSFPSLRSLYLHMSNPFDAAIILMITQMLKGLTSLRILLDIVGLINAMVDEQLWLTEDFFPLLLNAPNVTDLWIDADPNNELEDEIEIDRSVLEVFHQLPLKSLHLGQICMSDEDLQSNLAWVWPSISRLSMPRQPISFTLLSLFTQLHELRHLELQIDLDEIFHEYDETVSVLTVLQASPGSTLCSDFEQANQVMCALLKAFPKLTHINWPSDQQSASSDPDPTHEDKYEHVSCMNGHRAALVKIFALEKARQLQPTP